MGWIRLVVWGILCLIVGTTLLRAIPPLFGTPQQMVHVLWRDTDRSERAVLEQRFRLSEGVEVQGGRWAYVPLDTGRDQLRDLVRHPKVANTDGIDRQLFRMAKNGPLTARRGGLITSAPPLAARIVKLIAYVLVGTGGVLLLLAAIWRRWPVRAALEAAWAGWPRDARSLGAAAAAISRLVERGIPVASAEAAGIFRIAFGGLVLGYLLRNPVYPELLEPYELGRAAGPYRPSDAMARGKDRCGRVARHRADGCWRSLYSRRRHHNRVRCVRRYCSSCGPAFTRSRHNTMWCPRSGLRSSV